MRKLLTFEPSAELYARIKKIADASGLPMAQVMRLGVTHGLPSVEKQLLALAPDQPAAPSKTR